MSMHVCTIENGTYAVRTYIYECMYDICMFTCFVGKIKPTDIVMFNRLSSRGSNFTNGSTSLEKLCWAVSKVRLWILRHVECKQCRPMIRSLF